MLNITDNISNETKRTLLAVYNEIVTAYQEIEILFGIDTAKNLDLFTRQIILETKEGNYLKIMSRLKGLLLLGVTPVHAAKVVCDKYTLEPAEFIKWEDKPAPLGFLSFDDCVE